MTESFQYTGNKAGAIASGFFVGGASFLALAMFMIFFVVAPEGAPRNVRQDDTLLAIGLVICAMLASGLGWQVKRYFDRRAGRR